MERRDFLVQALAAGAYSTIISSSAVAQFWGKKPSKIQEGKSFFDIAGDVKINGEPANEYSQVLPGDRLTTGSNSKAIFVVGKDAFSMGENSTLELDGEIRTDQNPIIKAFSLLSGKLLTVFGSTGHQVNTPHTTLGIRGTGVYLEAEAEKSYVCICYGTVDIQSKLKPEESLTAVSKHHDQPRYVGKNSEGEASIRNAPMKNHTDMELVMLEALVGRTVPFVADKDYYGTPKRSDY